MLDRDEAAAYEAWKEDKLKGSIDLSVEAFNREMESLALAWEEGATQAFKDAAPGRATLPDILAKCPYRRRGMRGYRGEPDPVVAPGSGDGADGAGGRGELPAEADGSVPEHDRPASVEAARAAFD